MGINSLAVKIKRFVRHGTECVAVAWLVCTLTSCGKQPVDAGKNKPEDTLHQVRYDTLTSLAADLPAGDYIFKTIKGGHILMSVSTEEDTLSLAKGLVPHTIEALADKQTCNTDVFEGSERATVKTTKSRAPLETNVDAAKLFKALAQTEKNDCANRSTFRDTQRKPVENRNVKLNTVYLYTFKRQADEDYHLVVGSTASLATAYFFNVEISGEPPAGVNGRTEIVQARADFEHYFGIEEACARTYYAKDFRKDPIPVRITGSLFFDAHHCTTFRASGPQKWTDIVLQTAWEIHPITAIEFLK
jgi:hypothetical protein